MFDIRQLYDEVPELAIFDPARREPIKLPQDKSELIPSTKYRPLSYGSYQFRTKHHVQYGSQVAEKINEFIDGEASSKFESENIYRKSLVKTITQNSFAKEVLDGEFDSCVVMVSKNGCPACAYNTPILSALMEKFERKGLAGKIPFFKMSSENTVPHLGSFNYTPIFLFLKKQGNNITEIFTMKPPAKPEFVTQLSELSGNPDVS